MKILAAQPASASILHVYGDFDSYAPGKLVGLDGLKVVYLVPLGRPGRRRRCLVVEPRVSIKQPQTWLALVQAIGLRLWREELEVELLLAVEHRYAGKPAKTIADWAKLR